MLKLPENIDYIDTMFPRGAFVIRKFCEKYKGGRILDVGCGKGRITKFLGEQFGADILGVDIDENEISAAADSNEHENIQFACMDIREIEDSFTGILVIEVLEHLENPPIFLKEINRLCQTGGFLIITVPNGYSLKEALMAGIYWLKGIPVLSKLVDWYKSLLKRKEFNESPHLQHFTLNRVRMLIAESGFTIEEEFYGDILSGFAWMFFPWIPIPLFARRIECKLSKYLPHFLLGDWGFCCRKKL